MINLLQPSKSRTKFVATYVCKADAFALLKQSKSISFASLTLCMRSCMFPRKPKTKLACIGIYAQSIQNTSVALLARKHYVKGATCYSPSLYKPLSLNFTPIRIKNLNTDICSLKNSSTLVKASFQPSRTAWDLPELLDIQRASFNNFIKNGIPQIFSQMTPITVERGDIKLQLFLNGKRFELIAPDDSPRDCILKMKTYSCKLYVEAKILYTTLTDQPLSQTKSEWILIGHLPLMTKRGHFIINGSPRVIVHQVVRSPGIYFQQIFEKDENKRIRFYGDIIPRRGVWLRLQITKKGKIEGKLKKGKKVSAEVLQKCFQLMERLQNRINWLNYIDSGSNFFNVSNISSLQKQGFRVPIKEISNPLYEKRQNSLGSFKSVISEKKIENSFFKGSQISLLTSQSEQKALLYTYDKLYRPLEDKEREENSKKTRNRLFSNNSFAEKHSLLEKSYKNLFSTFKDRSRYDLGDLGRSKINEKLGICLSENQLTARDLYAVSNWLNKLTKGEKNVDDIDHFQNRRVRTSGELLHIQFENGIERLRKLAFNKLKELVHTKSNQRVNGDFNDMAVHFLHLKKSDNNKKLLIKKVRDENKNVYNSFLINNIDKTPINSQKKILDPKVSTSLSLYKRRLWNASDTRMHKLMLLLTQKQAMHKRSDAKLRMHSYAMQAKRSFASLAFALHACVAMQASKHACNANAMQSYALQARHRFVLPNESLKNTIDHLWISGAELKDLLSTKPLNGSLRELFGSNPLSQYMDQTNPLAEITHKRRMSSLGIGGVSRESAGMAIRGIHPTHYGRICPIETPEGKNAGLVNSLAFYAKPNSNGFVETPYYRVVKSQVQHELGWNYVSAKRESVSHLNIAPSDLQQSWNNVLTTQFVPVRVADNLVDVFTKVDSNSVDCMLISPVQMISVATSLIPFLEHNDANRALMGSNMQRQAVPLMIPERAIVGTGFETLVVAESGHLVQSECSGFVSYVSSNKIVVDALYSESNENEAFEFRTQTSCDTDPISSFSIKSDSTHAFALANASNMKSTLFCLKKDHRKNKKKRYVFPVTISSALHATKTRTVFAYPRTNVSYSLKNAYGTSHASTILVLAKANALAYKQELTKLLACFSMHRFYKRKSSPSLYNLNNSFFQYLWLQVKTSQYTQKFKAQTHVLDNWDRSNQDTCLTQRSLVNEFDWVQKGDLLTDCSASDKGELAVGKNILVAYIPWEGYNFEDAIVISERLVKQDVYTSLHVERYDFNAQDVKEGSEWFTNDLPGIPKHKVAHLNEFGLPQIGSFVKEGDILVGKMRYSNKKPTTPYERLLCDILGENNFAARDSSLYVPKGVHARVIKHKIVTFSEKLSFDTMVSKRRFSSTHASHKLRMQSYALQASKHAKRTIRTFAKANTMHKLCMQSVALQCKQSKCKYANRTFSSMLAKRSFASSKQSIHAQKKKEQSYVVKIPKVVHIFLGEKRSIQVGDKMSGRHGNKGVVAKLLPRQDMPYLADGTPIDIILNPLGVPSRMNVGQVFESLLGLAGTYLDQHFKITAWDELYGVEASQGLVYLKLYSAKLQSGQNWLFQVDFPGKTRLIDGRSGECFEQWITVGKAYMLKLIHMVNEKIHARATGPYALITQQPLRGRSQKGGQRLGEMEVWALEGWGAAYTLQELCTKKSDDIVGRKQVASTILPKPTGVLDIVQPVNRIQENKLILGQPEIFKVLICELQALCLDVGVYSLNTHSFQRSFLSKVD